MTIEKIPVRLSPDMRERIAQAERRGRFFAFHLDAPTGDFGFFETDSEDIFDFQRLTHSDWVYSSFTEIGGKEFTIMQGDNKYDPDWKLTAIDKDRNPRICGSFIVLGRVGKKDGLSKEDMEIILDKMVNLNFNDTKKSVLVID